MTRKVWIVAGEASGDTHASALMREILTRNPEVEFHGVGGPKMKALAGDHLNDWIHEAGVLGLWDVLKKYGYFKTQFDQMIDALTKLKPEAIILVDYPGFNLRMAKALRERKVHLKIIYYISPQVWAWNRGRIPKMARILDLMLCIFPFEKPLYEKSGLKTEFVGHPMMEHLALERTDEPRDPDLLGLFPGSREREVRKIFPSMLAAAKIVSERRPETRIEASAASPRLAAMMEEMTREAQIPCKVSVAMAHPLMQHAAAGLVCSGTATLEAAFFRLPYALVYKVAWVTYFVGRMLVTIKFLGIVNILAGRAIVKEFIQGDAQPQAMADEMLRLLNDPQARATCTRDLNDVISQLGETGASTRAAECVLDVLQSPSQNPASHHGIS
ncbi:MAG: lipid-A-disaccharide synthase [Chthoniobacterales bacterium]